LFVGSLGAGKDDAFSNFSGGMDYPEQEGDCYPLTARRSAGYGAASDGLIADMNVGFVFQFL
jgi:hypothetical protein